jgi:hypothetical protein
MIEPNGTTLFLQIELKAQSVGDFINAPLVANSIAGRRKNCRLPPVCVVFANADVDIPDAHRGNDHVGELFSGFCVPSP